MKSSKPLLSVAALLLVGCGEPADRSETRALEVIGAPDDTHPAVVAYVAERRCTATIVHVEGDTGYAITAAQCIPWDMDETVDLGVLRQGPDSAFGASYVEYDVTDAEFHPLFLRLSAYHVAVLKFSGATAETPVLPVLPPTLDTLTEGDELTLVGYGHGTDNGKRHSLKLPANVVTFDDLVFYRQDGAFFCDRDSGGPALVEVNGTEYVAGVNEAHDQGCGPSVLSLRMAGLRESFVDPYVQGAPYPQESCERCFNVAQRSRACVVDLNACLNSGLCQPYLTCRAACDEPACFNRCKVDHPDSWAEFSRVETCACEEGCAAECADDPICAAPTCLLKTTDTVCGECVVGSCCALAETCATSDGCEPCFLDPTAPGCDSDSDYAALRACLDTSCAAECPEPVSPEPEPEPDMGGDADPDMGVGTDEPDMAAVDSDLGSGNTGGLAGEAESGCSTVDGSGSLILPLVLLGLLRRRKSP